MCGCSIPAFISIISACKTFLPQFLSFLKFLFWRLPSLCHDMLCRVTVLVRRSDDPRHFWISRFSRSYRAIGFYFVHGFCGLDFTCTLILFLLFLSLPSFSLTYCRLLSSFFLDAYSHLYKRVCPSVGPSVGPLVRPLVRNTFFLDCKNEGFPSCKSSGRPRNITDM